MFARCELALAIHLAETFLGRIGDIAANGFEAGLDGYAVSCAGCEFRAACCIHAVVAGAKTLLGANATGAHATGAHAAGAHAAGAHAAATHAAGAHAAAA